MAPELANRDVQSLIDDLGSKMTKKDYLAFLEEIDADVQGKISCVEEELEAEGY